MCPLRAHRNERTPLFPAAGQRVMLRQGQTGDCYLIAALDCVLNSGEERRKAVESMFQETPEGVFLRIKRTGSLQLQHNKLQHKYTHRYDPETQEDIIFISREQLQEIDKEERGVKTNCLAVKIFERISAYYFAADWDANLSIASFKAHNHPGRHGGMPSGVFISHLLGIQVSDYSQHSKHKKIDRLIEIAKTDPSTPIYISMNFGERDKYGKYHGRHALRLEKITSDPARPNSYSFHLINPWNTEGERVILSYEEFMNREPNFCVFRDPFKEPGKKSVNIVKKVPELPDIFKKKINQFMQENKSEITKNINEVRERLEKLKQNREELLKNFDAALVELEKEVSLLETEAFNHSSPLYGKIGSEARCFYQDLQQARDRLKESFPQNSLQDFKKSCFTAIQSYQELPLLRLWRKILLTFATFIAELIDNDELVKSVDRAQACSQQEEKLNDAVKNLKAQLQEIKSDNTVPPESNLPGVK